MASGGEVWHDYIGPGKDAQLPPVVTDGAKGCGGREKNVRQHEAQKAQHVQSQLQCARLFPSKGGIPVGNEGAYAYHVGMKLLQKEHVLCQVPRLLKRRTNHKPGSCLEADGLQVKEAGLPDGVVNFIPGKGSVIGKVITASPDLAGFHFTGSTTTFNTLWRQIGENLGHYKSYPKIVGETGGKNYIFAHPSASALDVATAIVRGAFEYQGQKCSAGSRAYIPASLWKEVKRGQ